MEKIIVSDNLIEFQKEVQRHLNVGWFIVRRTFKVEVVSDHNGLVERYLVILANHVSLRK